MSEAVAEERRTIIVVDDSDEIRDVLTLVFESEGYRVLPVEDGQTAVVMSKHLRPALITLDVRLPGEDGAAVLHRLKSDPDTADVPVLVISGAVTPGTMSEADGILHKPFDLHEIQALALRLMGEPQRDLLAGDS